MRKFKRKNNCSLVKKNNFWIFVLSLLLLGQMGIALFTSPLFNLQQILVRGNINLSQEILIQASGLTLGRNLFQVKTREVAKRLIALPEISSARVYRVLPRTLVLEVKERLPYALLFVGNHYYLLDREGIPFVGGTLCGSPASLKQFSNLPRLTFQTPLGVRLGSTIRDPRFEYGWGAFKQMITLGVKPLECSVDPLLNLCLNIRDLKVRLGQPVDLPRKIELFKGLIQADPGMLVRAEYIDLSTPETPAWKPRFVNINIVGGTPEGSPSVSQEQ